MCTLDVCCQKRNDPIMKVLIDTLSSTNFKFALLSFGPSSFEI